MNKSEFVDRVKGAGFFETKKEAEKAVDAFVKAVKESLLDNESVELIGFGKFENAVQKAKEGTVPGTDKTYSTPEKMVPKFKPGKALKDAVAELKIPKSKSTTPATKSDKDKATKSTKKK